MRVQFRDLYNPETLIGNVVLIGLIAGVILTWRYF